jgi:LuxR family transcriptional regulator, maltose regulon positive regulatory protein
MVGLDAGDLAQREGRPQRANGPAIDLLASKLRIPMMRPGTVHRSTLIERLAHSDHVNVVSVVAPAGYGKTTLLAQWAEHDSRAFAWVSVDEADNDPKVLLSYVAHALNAVEPVSGRVFEALASPGSSVPGSVVPRLGQAFSSMSTPVALVLDDVHLLRNSECRAAVSLLADHVPRGSHLVLAGRGKPPLRTARLRVEGRILEIGSRDLALTREGAAWLLREAGISLGEAEVAELHRRTEGWPAGLYLAALYLREGGSLPDAEISFSGNDRLVSEYMESEFLSRISTPHRLFLTRTAVLDRMCDPLCQAVINQPGSAATLADLARSNFLLVPLDRTGEWYRYHHLFREMLLAELHRQEPDLTPVLRRRASRWCLRNDLAEEALQYSIAAGDVDTAAGLMEKLWLPNYRQGRVATVEKWMRWLDDRGGMESHPMAAVAASIVAAQRGQAAQAERWADMVDRWQNRHGARADDPVAEAWAAALRAILCRHGIKQMCADAEEAARKFAAGSVAPPVAALTLGIARVLSGDIAGGDASLQEAASIAGALGAHDNLALALSQRSLLASAHGEWSRAEDLAEQDSAAVGQARLESLLVCVAQVRIASHRGDAPAMRRHLVIAQRLRPAVTYAHPYLAVQARIVLAHVYLALADRAGARTLLREIDAVLKRRPHLGTLVDEAQALRGLLSVAHRAGTPGPSALTAAELCLLPMLSTHLSYPEIAEEMRLSLNTVRSQSTSLYRKLGVSARSQAVARSRDLGLIDR